MTSRWQRLLTAGTCSVLALLTTTVSTPSPASAGPPVGTVVIPVADQARMAIVGLYNRTSPYNMAAALGSSQTNVTQVATYVYYQRFQRGAIYWSSNTGANAVMGDIYTRWIQMGGWTGYGLPTNSETGTPDGVGRYNHFTGGRSIYWTPTTGAREIYGDIRARWAALGWERYGYPETGETGTPDGIGRFQHFNSGLSIYWTANTGAWEVFGDIRSKWASMGWEAAGYPVTGETGTPDGVGRFNHFNSGLSIYWTPGTGAHEVHGHIRNKWESTGWERGVGYPQTDETVTPDGIGRFNHFTNGSIYWTSTTGAHPVSGPIRDAWSRDGWEGGRGYPVTDPVAGSNAVCGAAVLSQRFATLSGANGFYCQDSNGWVRWVVPTTAPPTTTPTTRPATTTTTRPPASTTTTTTVPTTTGMWICSAEGVPKGLVATQIGPIAGCNATGFFVLKPTTSMWICAFGTDALTGFVMDQTNPSAGVCAFGPQYHITKV